MAKRPSVFGLDRFGMTASQLAALGSAKIKIHARLHHIKEKPLFKLNRSARLDKMDEHYKKLYYSVQKKCGQLPLDVQYVHSQPRGFKATLEASQITPFLTMAEIRWVFIDGISGRKRIAKGPTLRWYDAARRLRREFKEYEEPNLNADGYMLRWAFDRVLDVYNTMDKELDPRGTEVFSVYTERRMKPEYVWNPMLETRG